MAKLPKKEITLFDGVTVFALAIATNLVVQFVFGAVMALSGNTGDYAQLVFMVVAQIAWLTTTTVYFCLRNFNPRLRFPIEEARPNAALSVVLPVLSVAGFALLAVWFQFFLAKIGYNSSAGVEFDTPGKMALGIIATVILAPFCEELIFRGLLFSGLCKKFNPYIAALMSAVAFAFMHMNPEQTVYQLLLGYACAIAAYKSGSIVSSMVLHSGSNLIVVLLGGALDKIVDALIRMPAVAVVVTVLLALGCGAAIFGVCVAMKKIDDKFPRKNAKESDEASTESAKTDGCAADTVKAEEVAVAPEKTNSKNVVSYVIYGVTLGVCVITWIMVFVVAMVGA